MNRLIVVVLLLFVGPVKAYQNVDIALDTGTDLNLTEFAGEGSTLLIWLPSERGFGEGYVPIALDLTANDYTVWVANLHETYIVPTGRQSLEEMDIEDLVALIGIAQQKGYDEVFLMGSSRGIRLALKTAYLWQQQTPESSLIKGIISFSPHLYKGRTELGEQVEFIDIAAYSNLPIYLLLPQHSTKYAHSWTIARQLQAGGSPTYLHFIPGTQGGFHMRPNEDLTERDLEARAEVPDYLDQAMSLLRNTPSTPLKRGYSWEPTGNEALTTEKRRREPRLHPFKGHKTPPPLKLSDISGQPYDLQSEPQQVVLVNFWATWCGPCVEEIPSLSRLVERMKGKPFKVVAVNIGESAETIQQFVEAIPVNFDILLDEDGQVVRDWKVYAYPSNYLLDKKGLIQYAYRGALEWDAPEIVQTIEELL
ncbi:MAG: TlpA disulfide reductase family protein [Gammaproteobacteria bacterium]|nr:TlpA disulfide reductase family protein [Gammaproteobacteria bacterium]